MIPRTFVFLAGVVLLSGGMSSGRAQNTSAKTSSQSESLGDAARKIRAQKKHSGKPVKIFTNDDMGRLKYTPSIVGSQAALPSGTDRTAERAPDKKQSNGGDGTKDEAHWRAKFAAARKTLADDTRELDILQREFNLKQQQFYQDPNVALKQQYSRDDLNKTQSEIEIKRQAVEKDKQALSDLEDDLRKAGGNSGWGSERSQ